jgi:hypothetical protein
MLFYFKIFLVSIIRKVLCILDLNLIYVHKKKKFITTNNPAPKI